MKNCTQGAAHIPPVIAWERLPGLWLVTSAWLLLGGAGSVCWFLEISESGAGVAAGLVVLGWLGLMGWGVQKIIPTRPAGAPRWHVVIGIWATIGFSQLLVAGVVLVLVLGSAMKSLNF